MEIVFAVFLSCTVLTVYFCFVLFLDRITDQTVHAATDKEDG